MWPEAETSLTEFSADRGVAAFKPLSPGQTIEIKIGVKMSSCNCMLSGGEIAANTSTNVCTTIMQNGTYFTGKLCRWRTAKKICRDPLCLLWFPARIIWIRSSKLVNLEDLSSKITVSKSAVFSFFVLFLVLFLLYIYIFFWGLRTYSTYGIGYHFEILSSHVDPTKKRVHFRPWQ